jgi:hypothetical protein
MAERPGKDRPADRAAREVERVVAAAEEAASKIRAEAEQLRSAAARKAEETTTAAARDAEAMRARAADDAAKRVADAEQEARRIEQHAERQADVHVTEAQRAADEVLAEARAVSSGLRQLGETLESHAEGLLREVQAAHRSLTADLRLPPPGSDSEQPARGRRFGRTRTDSGGPEGLEVPEWVEPGT